MTPDDGRRDSLDVQQQVLRELRLFELELSYG